MTPTKRQCERKPFCSPLVTRRQMILAAVSASLLPGCDAGVSTASRVEAIWGSHGLSPGKFHKPRAIAVDKQDALYIVDMTGRIQVFDRSGRLMRLWHTPQIEHGKPCGLSIDQSGNLLVADTHYYRVLVYTPQGKLLHNRMIGGTLGEGPGQFGFVTDAVQDREGNYYVAEYGQNDRIQKFTPDGQFLMQWGGHGERPGKFLRPQALAVDRHNRLWVADGCNHRIQIFEVDGAQAHLVAMWGSQGRRPGQLRYPYGLVLDETNQHVYVCEFGNHRVQQLSFDGQPLDVWGVPGRGPGQLNQPWSLVQDSTGRIHVLDTYNHRVQTIRFS